MIASWWLACVDDPLAGLVLVGSDPPDRPIAGLAPEWQARFDQGDALFEQAFRGSTGLGPVYIRAACASCHADDGRGPGEVQKFVVVEPDGVTPSSDLLPWGHTARPYVAGGATTPLVPPDRADLRITTRAPNPVFGRGYLEAVREDEVERVAQQQAARGDAITGRPNRVPWQSEPNPDAEFHSFGPGDVVLGRFGLKGRIGTLDEFAADALQGDLSITSPLRPDELPNPDGRVDDDRPGVDVDAEVVNLLADYVRLLAIPERVPTDGADLFDAVGFAACHVVALRTRDDHPVPQLRDVEAELYTDLLLHDLGEPWGDSLPEFEASGTEWKTAPLVGLRHLPTYLHDGRAHTVEQAILGHRGDGSEADDVIDAFEALSPSDRGVVLRFVESL